MPLFVVVIIAIGFLSVFIQYNGKPVGYVDVSHVFANPQIPPTDDSSIPPVALVAYPDEEAASAALKQKEIQSLFCYPVGLP